MTLFKSARFWQGVATFASFPIAFLVGKAIERDSKLEMLAAEYHTLRDRFKQRNVQANTTGKTTGHLSDEAKMEVLDAGYTLHWLANVYGHRSPEDSPFELSKYLPSTDQVFLRELKRDLEDVGAVMKKLYEENAKASDIAQTASRTAETDETPAKAVFAQRVMSGDGN